MKRKLPAVSGPSSVARSGRLDADVERGRPGGTDDGPPTTDKGRPFLHPSSHNPEPLIEGEDFYREGAAVVFTARYHLRRGYCCGSGCRHCPFGDARASAPPAGVRAGSLTEEGECVD